MAGPPLLQSAYADRLWPCEPTVCGHSLPGYEVSCLRGFGHSGPHQNGEQLW